MKKQNIQAEIEFFNKVVDAGKDYDTISEDVYDLILNKTDSYFGNNLLETGCGSGSFGLRIKRRKPSINITGIDINQRIIDLAQKTEIYNNLICANLENKDVFRMSEFDAIICPYVLHHFPDITKATENFYHWLKPGGYLLIIEPNGSNLILKMSYFLRIVLSKFIKTRNYASVNESHKSIPFFLKSLKKFKICLIETFEHKSKSDLILFPFTLINILTFFRKMLLKFYQSLPFIKFSGSDLIIIAQKDEKKS